MTIPGHILDLFDDVRCVSLSYSNARYVAPWRINFPGQDETFGYLLEEGSAVLSLASGETLDLMPGDLAMVTPGHPHQLSSRDAGETSISVAIYRLDRARAAPLMKILPPAMVLKGENGAMSRWVRPLATMISDLRGATDAGGLAILRRLAEASLIRTAQEYLHHQLAIDPDLLGTNFYRIAPALRALHRRPEANWSVATLAREAGLSRTIFATLFTETMGEAPGHYLKNLRMAEARDLLRSGHVSVAEVAMRVGYHAEMAFSRAFKQHYGSSPGGFRKTRTVSDHPDGDG